MLWTYSHTTETRNKKYDYFLSTFRGIILWKRVTTFKEVYGFGPDSHLWFEDMKQVNKFLN